MAKKLSAFARRRRRLLASGHCDRCMRPALAGRTKCAVHSAKTAREVKAIYAVRMASGVCRQCGGKLAESSTLYCEGHLKDLRTYVVRSTKRP